MTITRTIALPLATLLAAGAFAGCGDSDTTADTGDGSTATDVSDASKPSSETGQFKLVAKPPKGFEDVAGTATLARNDGGTDVSIKLTGLKPNVKYVSHVHAGSCDQDDPGGPHFKFDPNGADTPPNEIHLPFESDADGNGTADAHNDKTVPAGKAGSLVVHKALPANEVDDSSSGSGHSHPPKIACAPLDSQARSGGTSAEPAGADADALKIEVKGGEPVGGVQSLTVKKGDEVRFTVTSDKTQEIHTHGYDIHKDAGPGEPAVFDFKASIEGIFEAEVEDTGTQILKLTVNPS